ncbi:MAG TPA: chemotaxis protein CheW [Polyangiaceae bacterium]|jgi:chemotaxis signal transduction protein|nr:chemotaxis protein CheW [Polyangiaceae bacterium]
MDDDDVGRKLAELRGAFDAAFAAPPPDAEVAVEKFLVTRSGGVAYAIRLGEIGGVAVDRRATPVPGPLPELLGLTAVRGKLVPVYSLSALLGTAAAAALPRWLILGEREELAFAVDAMDGYVFGHRVDVLPSSNRSGHCPETLRLENSSMGILSVSSLMKRIANRVASTRPLQEH